MTLSELKQAVEDAIERAADYGESPDEIVVSVQVDDTEGKAVWADDVSLHYDNNTCTSGCVLLGYAGYDTEQ